MESREVIAGIGRVYDRFRIMHNLRTHMFRVAAVGRMICDSWNGPAMDKDMVTAALLLHDLGNIVKFRLDTQESDRIIGAAGARDGTDWLSVQRETVQRYGHDVRAATRRMAEELNVDGRTVFLIDSMGSSSLDSQDSELKVCSYSDARVGPYGVISVADRFDDLIRRYGDNPAKSAFFAKIATEFPELERRIFSQTSIAPHKINDDSIAPYVEKFSMPS